MTDLTALGAVRGGTRPDWRLVPAALAVWSAALLGLLFGWGLGYVIAGSAGLLGVLVLVAARRGSEARRWHRLGVGVSLLICTVLIAWPLSARLRHAADDPLRASAARAATAHLRVVITERPHPISSRSEERRVGKEGR